MSAVLSWQLDDAMPRLPPPSKDAMVALVQQLRAELGMALFGVDVIVNIHTHTLTVIDINIFPGRVLAAVFTCCCHEFVFMVFCLQCCVYLIVVFVVLIHIWLKHLLQ